MFEGRVAVITGASRGIGRAIALALAGRGADVVLAARDRERLAKVAQEVEALGRKALVVPGDLRQEEAVEALRQETLRTFGTVDIVVLDIPKLILIDYDPKLALGNMLQEVNKRLVKLKMI